MCTVSIIPIPAEHTTSYRVAFNRDEFRIRCPGLPPRQVTTGPHDAVMPIDPQSGGTWIGGNSAGLVLGILNRTTVLPRARLTAPVSRGVLIPRLLAHASVLHAAAAVADLIPGGVEPFQLFLLDLGGWATVIWDGRSLTTHEQTAVTQPLLLTSSNLGDELVYQPRRALFDSIFGAASSWQMAQDAFHRHHWPDQPELSVCMSSTDAGTLSHTVIQLDPSGVEMAYFSGPPDQEITPVVVSLPLMELCSMDLSHSDRTAQAPPV